MLVNMQLCFDLNKSEYVMSIIWMFRDNVNLLVVSQ